MFQYATAYAVARRNCLDLKLDTSAYENPAYFNPEGFLLEKVFDISRTEARFADYYGVLGLVALLLRTKYKLPLERTSSNYIRERTRFIEDPRIVSKSIDAAYLLGWWQVESYFKDYEDEIRSMYTFNSGVASSIEESLLEEIKASEAVGIHVRRGDYVTHPVHSETYVTCSPEYYSKALEIVLSELANPKVFVFTDDPEWAVSQPLFRDHRVCSVPGQYSWHDMYLMSQCQHNIISNSTFSWWGAWLNQYPKKIVVAPQNWFSVSTPVEGLIPSRWVKISA